MVYVLGEEFRYVPIPADKGIGDPFACGEFTVNAINFANQNPH